MIRRRTIVLSISSILATALSVTYWKINSPQIESKIEKPDTADYIVEGVAVRQFDSNGEIVNLLKAKKLEYYKSEDASLVEYPEIRLTSFEKGVKAEQNEPPKNSWLVRANKGQLKHQFEEISLNGNVTISQYEKVGQTRTNARLNTEKLTYNLANNSATSSNGVTIQTKTTHTKAQSITIDFEKSKVEMQGEIETQGTSNAN